MLKKSTSGPDLGLTNQSRSHHAIDMESGERTEIHIGGGGGDRSGSPLSKRHGAAPSPHGSSAHLAGPGPSSALGFSPYSASATPVQSAAAKRARSLQAAAGASYVVSSAALILLNKKVLVHYSFNAVHALLFYHCA